MTHAKQMFQHFWHLRLPELHSSPPRRYTLLCSYYTCRWHPKWQAGETCFWEQPERSQVGMRIQWWPCPSILIYVQFLRDRATVLNLTSTTSPGTASAALTLVLSKQILKEGEAELSLTHKTYTPDLHYNYTPKAQETLPPHQWIAALVLSSTGRDNDCTHTSSHAHSCTLGQCITQTMYSLNK